MERSRCNIQLPGEELEFVDEFEYLEVKFSRDGNLIDEIDSSHTGENKLEVHWKLCWVGKDEA